jgi:hypothetical protein
MNKLSYIQASRADLRQKQALASVAHTVFFREELFMSLPEFQLWAGRVLSGIVAVFLFVDALGKLLRVAPVMEGTAKLGYPQQVVFPLGVLLLIGLVLYLVPKTAVLGAIFLTAFLGGAVAAHYRIGSPFATHVLFGVYVAVFIWGGLVLRNPRLWTLLTGGTAS